MFTFISLCILAIITVNNISCEAACGVAECPSECVFDPCFCSLEVSNNTEIGIYDVGRCKMTTCHANGCDQCEDGFFKRDYDYPCTECHNTVGEGCKHCSDFIGCQQCKSGYELVKDDSCGGLWYCSADTSCTDTPTESPTKSPTTQTTSISDITTTEDDSTTETPCPEDITSFDITAISDYDIHYALLGTYIIDNDASNDDYLIYRQTTYPEIYLNFSIDGSSDITIYDAEIGIYYINENADDLYDIIGITTWRLGGPEGEGNVDIRISVYDCHGNEIIPTAAPTLMPTIPTNAPTDPTTSPTDKPTNSPTNRPTTSPVTPETPETTMKTPETTECDDETDGYFEITSVSLDAFNELLGKYYSQDSNTYTGDAVITGSSGDYYYVNENDNSIVAYATTTDGEYIITGSDGTTLFIYSGANDISELMGTNEWELGGTGEGSIDITIVVYDCNGNLITTDDNTCENDCFEVSNAQISGNPGLFNSIAGGNTALNGNYCYDDDTNTYIFDNSDNGYKVSFSVNDDDELEFFYEAVSAGGFGTSQTYSVIFSEEFDEDDNFACQTTIDDFFNDNVDGTWTVTTEDLEIIEGETLIDDPTFTYSDCTGHDFECDIPIVSGTTNQYGNKYIYYIGMTCASLFSIYYIF